MATIYKYFHVGNQSVFSNDINYQSPILLTFSKIKNGMRGETKPHSHTHLELFYFESGSGFLELNSKKYPLRAHDLLVINSRYIHVQYSENCDTPLVYYDFAIDNVHMNGLPQNCIGAKEFFLHSFQHGNNVFYQNILRILNEFDCKQYSYHSKVQAIFIEILVDTVRLFSSERNLLPENENPNTNRSQLEQIKKYIDEHYSEQITLDQLSKIIYINKSYIVTQFKKLFNVSPIQYLTLVRMEHAKNLLSSTSKSVTEIAAEVGFNNPVYFTEIFSRTIGVPPSVFRKNVSEE